MVLRQSTKRPGWVSSASARRITSRRRADYRTLATWCLGEYNGVLCDLERRGRDSSSDQKLEGLLSQQRLLIANVPTNHNHNVRCYGSVAGKIIPISTISQWS